MTTRPDSDLTRTELPFRSSENSIDDKDWNCVWTIDRFLSFVTLPRGIFEYVVPTELTALWRRHLMWAKKDGDVLLKIVVARYASATVFLSLLVGAEIGVFFSPSQVVEDVRVELEQGSSSLHYWTGIVLIVSIFVALSALLAYFSAWSTFAVLSNENTIAILRSSAGLYAAQLPSRLAIAAIYLFFTWIGKFRSEMAEMGSQEVRSIHGTHLNVIVLH